MKTIRIVAKNWIYNNEPDRCNAMKLFNLFSSQILSNVETLEICNAKAHIFYFIVFMPKLRKLIYSNCTHTSVEAANILSMVGSILYKRDTERTNRDSIEIMVEDELAVEKFSVHSDINSSIKLAIFGRQ